MSGFLKSIGSFLTKAFPNAGKYLLELLVLATATVLVIAAFILYQNKMEEPEFSSTPINSTSEQKTTSKIMVQLAGAVLNGGVFEVTSGARLKDILGLAGGLSKNADKSYFEKNFNLAKVLKDQEKIYIPTREDLESGLISDVLSSSTPTKININTSSVSELDSLPGIGQVTAQTIIKSRPYKDLGDLQSKKVISTSTLQKIMDRIEF